MGKLVSIIVPIYKVEAHIEKCVKSLMEQTYQTIEFLFVDDCTPDQSITLAKKIVDQFPKRVADVKFLEHKENKGLPAARNTGLSVAKGDYVFHCDSDDWIDENMIENMVRAIVDTEADIVYSDFYLSFHKNERYMNQPSYSNAVDCIKAMLDGSMKFNVWNKLIRRSLYTEYDIVFPAGHSMGEDMTIIKLFCHADTVAHIPNAYYHYMQTNMNAFTKQVSEQQLADVQENVNSLIAYLTKVFGQRKFEDEVNFFKLNMKLSFLITLDTQQYKRWSTWYPEANEYIDRNPSFSSRIKFIQKAAMKKQFWLIKLYNIIIGKLVYGIIYR